MGTGLFRALWVFGIITGVQLSVTQFELGISFKFRWKHVCCYSILLRGLENRFAPCFFVPLQKYRKKSNWICIELREVWNKKIVICAAPCNLNWRMVIMIFAYKLAINWQPLRMTHLSSDVKDWPWAIGCMSRIRVRHRN